MNGTKKKREFCVCGKLAVGYYCHECGIKDRIKKRQRKNLRPKRKGGVGRRWLYEGEQP